MLIIPIHVYKNHYMRIYLIVQDRRSLPLISKFLLKLLVAECCFMFEIVAGPYFSLRYMPSTDIDMPSSVPVIGVLVLWMHEINPNY